jgi:hypothetical protein
MRRFLKKEFVAIISLIGWMLVALVPGQPQEILRPGVRTQFPKDLGRDITLQVPMELGRDTTLEFLLSIDPRRTAVILNRNANPIQFHYFDQSWKIEKLDRRSLKALSCAACQNIIKVSFDDAVQNQLRDLKLGTFSIFDKAADSNRWELVTAE